LLCKQADSQAIGDVIPVCDKLIAVVFYPTAGIRYRGKSWHNANDSEHQAKDRHHC
jgi:hypothetical protein